MLSDTETALLDFEAQRWNYLGAKEQAVHDLFGVSLTRYTQQVNALLDSPEAFRYAPQLVARLRRLRERRADLRR